MKDNNSGGSKKPKRSSDGLKPPKTERGRFHHRPLNKYNLDDYDFSDEEADSKHGRH